MLPAFVRAVLSKGWQHSPRKAGGFNAGDVIWPSSIDVIFWAAGS